MHIPEKLYFTIGEVSEICSVRPHVLRYWEQEFPQLKPEKKAGNRRRYRRDDVELVQKIRELLHDKGFTIVGARQQLDGKSLPTEMVQKEMIKSMIQDMEDLLEELKI